MSDVAELPCDLVESWLQGRNASRGVPMANRTDYGWSGRYLAHRSTLRHLVCSASAIEPLMTEDQPLSTQVKFPGWLADWRGKLPASWSLDQVGQTYLMTGPLVPVHESGPGVAVRIHTDANVGIAELFFEGQSAASARCGVTGSVAVFDQVKTHDRFQRKGYATVMLGVLSVWAGRQGADSAVYMATEDGKKLYETVGGVVKSPFLSALKIT